MAEDTAPDGGAEADRADELLARLLAQGDLSEEELVDRLLAVAAATDPEAESAMVEPARVEELETNLNDGIRELDSRLGELDEEFQAKIEDVRKRVIQVKRLTDSKAAGDHDHEELDEIASRLEKLAAEITAVETRFEEGFENYESILEYLTDSLGTINERLPVLAEAVVALRDEVDIIVEQATYQERLTALAQTANEHGVRRARCDSCSGNVDLSLLQEPRCPHCQSLFRELDASTGFFGAHTLSVDEAPALEGETVDRTDLASILDADTASPPEEMGAVKTGSGDDGAPARPDTEPPPGDEDGDADVPASESTVGGDDGFVFDDT